jgi:hypothetical protein
VKIPCFLPAGDGRRSKIRTSRAWTEDQEGTLDNEMKSRRIMQAVQLAGQTEQPTWDRWTDVPPQREDTPGGLFTIQSRPKSLASGLAQIKLISPNPPLVAGPSCPSAAVPSCSTTPNPETRSRSGSLSKTKKPGE